MNDAQITTRLPADLIERMDALLPQLRKDPRYRAFGRITRSTVIRLAMERGLAVLESEIPKTT